MIGSAVQGRGAYHKKLSKKETVCNRLSPQGRGSYLKARINQIDDDGNPVTVELYDRRRVEEGVVGAPLRG